MPILRPELAQEGIVVAVSRSFGHTFSKQNTSWISLIEGQGVEGDAHCGTTVKHRSRVARDPSQPNLRQVHLIHSELIDELKVKGFDVAPGTMGENVTTRGIALLNLPRGSTLHLGETAQVGITGLRNPCLQLDRYQEGLMSAVLHRDEVGNHIRKAGVMAIVMKSGIVRAGDPIRVQLPTRPYADLLPV